MKHSILTLTGLAIATIGCATAQEPIAPPPMPSVQEIVAQSPLSQYAQSHDMPVLQAQQVTFNVQSHFKRMRCERGETKELIMHGKQDNFSAAGSEPASRSARLIANQDYSYPFVNRYDDPRRDRHFADNLSVPSHATRGFIAFGLRTNGSSQDTNDSVTMGDMSGGQTPGQRRLYGHNISTLGAPFANTGNDHWASLSNVQLQASGQTLLSLIQSGGGTSTVDVHVQDDHSVDYVAIGVCLSKTDAVLETDGCAGKDVTMNSKYGPGVIREYCYGDPIIFSTDGTTPADNYFVGLQTFDPMIWEGQSQIYPGAWTCNNGTCPPPAHLMPASYNNPAGEPLAPNAPGEVYMFTFAVGPTWDSEMILFRVFDCPDIEIVNETLRGRIEQSEIEQAQPLPR